MKKLAWRLLSALKDGAWHLQPPKGVGPRTVDALIQAGLVTTKTVPIASRDKVQTFFMPIQLTAKGRIAYLDIQSDLTGRVPRELREHRLRGLRKMIGSGVVRSLQGRTAVVHAWRRSVPTNWFVINRRGEQLWHNHDRERPDSRMLEAVRQVVAKQDGFLEEIVYRLKRSYC